MCFLLCTYSIIIIDNLWLHGTFDGMINFYAEDLRKAKQFHELLLTTYDGNVSDSELLEEMVVIKKDGFMNPKVIETKNLMDS